MYVNESDSTVPLYDPAWRRSRPSKAMEGFVVGSAFVSLSLSAALSLSRDRRREREERETDTRERGYREG
jgi:hypothetical protein